uniref:Uncharacterized protein n=1 Tax=Amphimedon queenslandica TaxID=400682 RepID=A0A1X7TGG5_AMPQE
MSDLAVLKRTRGGHRAIATLRKFDEQILPHVDPGVLDKEIEDSEGIKDELFLAMSIFLLEGKAKETIAGLALTDANYSTAIDLLEKRFGSKERITAAHMDVLMSLDAVSSDHHIFELRRLYDKTESTIRSRYALGVPVDSYGALLAPVFIKKLPSQCRLAIARKVPADDWNMTRILEVLLAEVEARERASLPKTKQSGFTPKRGRDFPTTATFTGGSQSGCCFCQQEDHTPAQCTKVTGVDERKRMIREQGRCFVCLRPGHIKGDITLVYV